MLQSLHIINFAIIKDTVLDPASGVTICTGETGSGKSIVIDALAVLMGRRAKIDFIRTVADYFKIEGVFYVDDTIIEDLQKEGIDTDGNQLILSRRLNRNGRGICTINGNFCTVRQLQSLGSKLVRLHEQNDNMELLSIPFCERMVDTGTPDVIASYKKYRELYEEWKKLKDDLDDYKLRKQERERRLDTLEWELNQINAANLHEGEDEEVTSKLNILQNHEKILRALQGALDIITADNGVQDCIAKAVKEVSIASSYDNSIASLSESLDSVAYSLEDAITGIESYLSGSDFSEEELSGLQERNEVILEMKKKFGPAIKDVIAYEANAKAEYDSLKEIIYDNDSMREKFSVLTKMVMQAAESLNHLRQVSSARILNRVVDILKDMGMNNARMELHLVPAKEPVPNGALEMEFYFSANTGEPLRSMKDTASGGEISRIALAIEMVISNLLKRQTLIFDEIDVGISGRVAIQVAKKIGILSKSLQILCITHLPQTACIADKHYKIAKKVIDGHTFAEADLLNESQHLNAIALMISGTYDSASALESAREMEKSVKNG